MRRHRGSRRRGAGEQRDDVGQDVHEDVERCEQQDDELDHRDVPVGDRVHEPRPIPG